VWSAPVPVPRDATKFTLIDLPPGEQFQIQVDSVSHHVPSGKPVEVTQIIDPQPVSPATLLPLLDAENVTLTWPRPAGRIDFYYVTWFPLSAPEEVRVKELPGDTEPEAGLVRFLVEGLHPGVQYQFEITSESHQRRSRTIQTKIRTQPLCTSELFIIPEEVSTALTLRYTPTPLLRSTFDTYRFMLSDPEIPVKEKAAKDHERKVTFVDLVPGRMYNISLWTVSGGVTSRPVERQDRLHPQPVDNINATEITDKQITLVWDSPQGDFDSFEVQYLDAQGRLIQNFTYSNTITIGGLRPYRNYTFTVVTKAGTDQSIPKRSTTISESFSTRESVPGSLTSFEPIDVQPRQITFQWELPDLQANGVITGFTIQWGPKAELGKPFIPEESRHFEALETQGTITGLEPGKKYTFQMQARTKVGYGPQVRKEQKMPILPPPTPASDVFPTEIYRSMHTVTVRFRKNYFSDVNGKVLGYSVLVTEDLTKHTEGEPFLPSWRDVQKFSVWPPYQVIDPYFPFNNSSVEDFTVGTEDCSTTHGRCNGKLKPGTIYRFKVGCN
jgi:cadherin 5 type 2 (VE-cadherin)